MGLMDKLSSIAAGPAGQVLGGFLSGEIEEQRLAAEIERKKDESKAGLVLYTQQKLIDENISNISTANKKVDAIESLEKRGIPKYVIYEMERNGFFNQDNPNNALGTAQEMWGDRFWLDETNPYFKEFASRSGQYEVPDVANKYQTKVSDWQGQINGVLNNDLGIGNDTVKFLTEGTTTGETIAPGVSADISSDAAGSNITQNQIPQMPVIKSAPTFDVEETQFRMALQNPEFLTRLGFEFEDTDFTADGEFNWAAFMSKSPEANSAITLLYNVAALPYAAIANGRASELGLGHMMSKHITNGKIYELGLANTIGLLTSDVIKGVSEEAEKELIIDTIRNNNPDLDIGNYTTEKLISMLNRTTPNWLDRFNSIEFSDNMSTANINPFIGTPLESAKLGSIDDEAFKNYTSNKLNQVLYDPRKPITYLQLRDLHSKYYGTQSTLTTETGLLAPDDPVFSGTGRSEQGGLFGNTIITSGGATAEEIQYSEQYMVPSSVAFKKDKIGETYTPVQGMGETSSVLLSGTDMDTPEKIDDILKQYVGDVEGLEAYVMSIIMGQQETGMLPKQLTPMDMQILKDAVLDDIFDFEYNVKEDKADAGGSIDETDVEEEVIKNVEDSIITEDFPVDTKVSTTKTTEQLELEKKQKERKDKIDNIVDNATSAVEKAQQFLEDNKSKDREELEQIGKDREEKVINWFKNIFKGE